MDSFFVTCSPILRAFTLCWPWPTRRVAKPPNQLIKKVGLQQNNHFIFKKDNTGKHSKEKYRAEIS